MARIAFLLDEHMPYVIARELRRRGILVETARDASLLGMPDEAYLTRGRGVGRVIVTNDADFLALHHRSLSHAGIVYYRQQSRSIGEIVGGLALIHEVLEPTDMAGKVEFL